MKPKQYHLVVSNPSTPTGPRAWILPVLIPTSAPSPNRKPSENLVLALWNTAALVKDNQSQRWLSKFVWSCYLYLSTWRRNSSATSGSSVTMQSVCALRTRQDKRVSISNTRCKRLQELMSVMWSFFYLPCPWMWSIAPWTSSTTSTVQDLEQYSCLNDLASGMFSIALALGPPYKVTPAVLIYLMRL